MTTRQLLAGGYTYASNVIGTEGRMATAEHPLTRAALREELQHYATKEDLAKIETKIAEMESRLTWRIVVAMFGAAAAGSAVVSVIDRFAS